MLRVSFLHEIIGNKISHNRKQLINTDLKKKHSLTIDV